jgi:hypothetical protein
MTAGISNANIPQLAKYPIRKAKPKAVIECITALDKAYKKLE